jgi:putative two-component system response regulator
MRRFADDNKGARILIVDDEAANVMLLEHILESDGYTNFESVSDPRQVLPRFLAQQPDLILLDVRMPHLDGFAVMDQLRHRIAETLFLPIVILTADVTSDTKQAALEAGASDFLTKPIDVTEVLLRIKNLLRTRTLHVQVQNQNAALEDRVRERTRELLEAQAEILHNASELREAQIETLQRLALASEYRDDDTGQHVHRVSSNSAMIARALGMEEEKVELIRKAAPLHDVGKIGIPDNVLLKPGKLTPEEWNQMKTHTLIGAGILRGSRFPLLQMAEEIALTHHEKWDGTGYSPGLKEEAIPLAGRIVAVADVFDALTHERPYKKAWPVSEAVQEIVAQKGRHFDPKVVDAFLQLRTTRWSEAAKQTSATPRASTF